MADERVLTTVLHIDGGSGKALEHCYIAPGRSVFEWAAEQGVTWTTEYRREPWTQTELDRGKLESTVAQLREEFPDEDYPATTHPADEPCTYCEAIRFLER